MDRWTALLTAVAGIVGALAYISRQIRRGLRLMDQLGTMPAAHRQLAQRTEENTEAIGRLSNEVAWLRAAMAARRGR